MTSHMGWIASIWKARSLLGWARPLTAADFRAGTSALDASELIIYDSATDQIQYDANGIGGAEVQIAKLAAGRVLDHTDLVIL